MNSDLAAADDPLIVVRRQYNDHRMAGYRLSRISGLHWSSLSGGARRLANRTYMHGYVFCDAMESGELGHSCVHGPPPHRIKVCITQKYNERTFKNLLSVCPK